MTSCERNLLVKNAKNGHFFKKGKVAHEEPKETNICQKIFIQLKGNSWHKELLSGERDLGGHDSACLKTKIYMST